MGDRDIIVFGTSAGEASRRRQHTAGEEDEIIRLVWRNSERRKAEERQQQESGWMKAARVLRTLAWLMVAFFTSLGIYMFLALIL